MTKQEEAAIKEVLAQLATIINTLSVLKWTDACRDAQDLFGGITFTLYSRRKEDAAKRREGV